MKLKRFQVVDIYHGNVVSHIDAMNGADARVIMFNRYGTDHTGYRLRRVS